MLAASRLRDQRVRCARRRKQRRRHRRRRSTTRRHRRDDVACASSAVVDDRPPAVSGFALRRRRASCRRRAALGDRRRVRHAVLRVFAGVADERLPDVRRGVRRHPASRLLRDEGESDARDPGPVRAARQRLRHRVGRRARARASPRAAIAARSSSRASARATPRWRRRSPPASCASTSNRAASSIIWRRSPRRMGMRAPISFRVNPDVDPLTHPYIATGLKDSKFGVALDDAHALYRRAAQMPSIVVRGIDMHIGSQITELAPYREAAARMLALVDALAAEGIALDHVDLGGGLGIRYRDEEPVAIADYAAMVRALFARPPRTAAVRARPPAGRRRRRAADARTRRQAGRGAQFRDRRRGDERPAAPVAVRRVARRRSGASARRRAATALRRRRADLRKRRLPGARSRARARARATCSPCGRPAHTRWR